MIVVFVLRCEPKWNQTDRRRMEHQSYSMLPCILQNEKKNRKSKFSKFGRRSNMAGLICVKKIGRLVCVPKHVMWLDWNRMKTALKSPIFRHFFSYTILTIRQFHCKMEWIEIKFWLAVNHSHDKYQINE